jgi:hypothetical protein
MLQVKSAALRNIAGPRNRCRADQQQPKQRNHRPFERGHPRKQQVEISDFLISTQSVSP